MPDIVVGVTKSTLDIALLVKSNMTAILSRPHNIIFNSIEADS